MAARTGSARKSIADSRFEGRGGPGVATVHPPDLCKVNDTILVVDQPLTALAVKRPRPGLRRPDGRLRGGGALRVQLQLDRQGQAVRALRPPSSATRSIASMPRGAIYRFLTRHRDAERKHRRIASRSSLGLGLGK